MLKFNFKTMTERERILYGVGYLITIVILAILSSSFVEDVDAKNIVINQVPISGELQYWTTAGTKLQLFGGTTTYPKSFQIWFSAKEEQGSEYDEAIEVLFNDGGKGKISGSIRILMPLDAKHLYLIHTNFGSIENLVHELVKPTVAKAVFLTGPLMNSYESYAAKKSELIGSIEDQLKNGIYKTITRQQKVVDDLSGKEKVVTVAEPIKDPKAPHGIARQETAPFEKYGLNVAAVSIEQIAYDKQIQQQIETQQRAQMEVQTAIAETKKQEQQLIQEEKKGMKEATIAKWQQEVIKAKMITEAEQKKEVARLDKEAAEFTKQKEILLGQGESERKRLVMEADGQLALKLDTYYKVQQLWADAVSKYQGNWVPTTVFGQTQSGYTNGAQAFMDILTAKTMKELSLDANPKR